MSAFILPMKELNQIVNGLKNNGYGADGQQLLDMNCKAVNQRYGETSNIPFEKMNTGIPLPLVALIKKLNCYLYQCSEGDVPEMKLYKAMKAVKLNLCEKYVMGTPAYDNAEW